MLKITSNAEIDPIFMLHIFCSYFFMLQAYNSKEQTACINKQVYLIKQPLSVYIF